ncbi:MAG: hexose kinase [Mycoplasmataceae bacterium]|nr:hexose kinase [Mycoplasmataceae bacterium]
MIYTLTLNPAIDYVINKPVVLTNLIRFADDQTKFTIGGKGINASFILNELGIKNKAITPTGGDLGDFLVKQLKIKNINLIKLDQELNPRLNVKLNLKTTNYEFNGPIRQLNSKAKHQLHHLFKRMKDDDYLLLMGSIHLDDFDFIEHECKELKSKNVKLVLDIDSQLLLKLLKYQPFFIKPNHLELSSLLNKKIRTQEEIITGINDLQKLGAKNIAITMGAKGTIASINNQLFKVDPIKINLISPSGAGDSFVAGFISEYIKNSKPQESLIVATACATASASSIELAKLNEIKNYKKQVIVTNL